MKRFGFVFAFTSMALVACAMSPGQPGAPRPSTENSPPPPPAPPPVPQSGMTPASGGTSVVPESDKGGATSTGTGSSTAPTDVPVGPTNVPGPTPKPPVAPTTMPKDATPTEIGAAQAAFDKSAASFGVAGNDCQQLCKALASMQNAAAHLCQLTQGGGEKKRCTDAQGRVTSAKERVKQTCGGCGP